MHIQGITSQRFLQNSIPKVEQEARLTQRDCSTLNVSWNLVTPTTIHYRPTLFKSDDTL